MTSAKFPTRLVSVLIEERYPGVFFATSNHLKGLYVVKESLEEALAEIPLSIAALYDVCGEPVIVERVESFADSTDWVAMPVFAARAALDRVSG